MSRYRRLPGMSAFFAVVDQELLEILIAQQRHGAGEVWWSARGNSAANFAISAAEERPRTSRGFTRHFLVDPLKAFTRQRVLYSRSRSANVLDDSEIGRVSVTGGSAVMRSPAEVGESCRQAVKDGEVRLVRNCFPLRVPRRASVQREFWTSRPQEHDEFQVRISTRW